VTLFSLSVAVLKYPSPSAIMLLSVIIMQLRYYHASGYYLKSVIV